MNFGLMGPGMIAGGPQKRLAGSKFASGSIPSRPANRSTEGPD